MKDVRSVINFTDHKDPPEKFLNNMRGDRINFADLPDRYIEKNSPPPKQFS